MTQYVRFSMDSGDSVAIGLDTRCNNWAETAQAMIHALNTQVGYINQSAHLAPNTENYTEIPFSSGVKWLKSCGVQL